uniref:Uncharacterized protein n=1 Tax=Anguilla anguilla TaxID=7936 RepID=A0A0E9R349_ANGAN
MTKCKTINLLIYYFTFHTVRYYAIYSTSMKSEP